MNKLILNGWHWVFGWLRRPEMDDHRGFCYEKPSGDLFFSQRKDHRLICRLESRMNQETGEIKVYPSGGATRAYIELYGKNAFGVRKKAA